jgi:hypothetical protein
VAPPNGRFQRVLPRTVLGRVFNFVLFSILEPILPTKDERRAQMARAIAGQQN